MIVSDASCVIALRDPEDLHHQETLAINCDIGGEDTLLHSITLAECLVTPAQLGLLEVAAEMLRAKLFVTSAEYGVDALGWSINLWLYM